VARAHPRHHGGRGHSGRGLHEADPLARPPALALARSVAPEAEFLLGGLDPVRLCAARRIVLSPGVPRQQAALQAAGITVEQGLLADEAEWLNRGFLMRARQGRPWVRVKLAMSLDGRTAMASGESKWITGEAARADVQDFRARASAVLTGLGTVLADDPRLTARVPEGVGIVPPLRVVLDPRGALPRACRLLDSEAPTLVAHADDVVPDYGPAVEGFAVPRTDGHLDLAAVLAQLAMRQVNEVQVEAGATLAGAFLRAGLVDELLLYVAPVLLGERGRPLFDGLGFEHMSERIGFERIAMHAFEDGDVRLTYRPRR